ncbi:MAG TPA: glycosyltransferase family 2 protein [Bdellovibrionota bacterium]|nr:glycosyltransferase family 2 protein [Bdellovibrionota bacterium]
MKIALVILSFNEIEGVTELLPYLKDKSALKVDDIFAVDGGSTDGTLEQYAKHGVRVLRQTSRGRGEAMRFASQGSDADYLVFFSSDGNEDWKDIARFREFFEAGHDLVIASRMMRGAHNEEDGQWIRARKWVNNIFNLVANVAFRRTGPYVTDSINGFRGMRRGLLAELGVDAMGYTVEYQTTIRSLKTGKKIMEFPTHEGARIGGETKAPSFPTGVQFLKCLWRELRAGRRVRLPVLS